MDTSPQTQREAIARALFRGEPVTVKTARKRWGCLRLAARIYELRKRGVIIKMESRAGRRGQPLVNYRLAMASTLAVPALVAPREAWAG